MRSVRRRGSAVASSRANCNVAPIMESISAMLASILSRSCASPAFSARNRNNVNGVRRSCEIAASMRVRFSTRPRSRACIALNARDACCVSIVPVSGIGGAFKSLPSRSAAAESDASGAVTRRTAHTETARMTTAMIPIDRRNCRENAEPLSGRAVTNESHWPSGRGTATCRSRKPPKPPKAPMPCIIGPRPIMGCQPPGPEPSGNADTRGCRAGPSASWSTRKPFIAWATATSSSFGVIAGGFAESETRRPWSLKPATIRSRHSRGASCTRRVELAMRCAAAKPPTARTASSRSSV